MSVTVARARLAGLYTHGRVPDPVIADEARRELTLAKLERAAREALAADPALTREQRERVAALLLSGGDAA